MTGDENTVQSILARLETIEAKLGCGCGGATTQASAGAQKDTSLEMEIANQMAAPADPQLGVAREVMNICCSSPVPAGWIKVNDSWSPTSCGNPTSIVYNVCTIERYNNKPIGAVMNVCASAPTPNGWVITNTSWSPTSCGHPTSIVHNVKTIKRVS